MPGLIRGMARTAVVAGTASAVAGNVHHRQAKRWSAQEAEAQAQAAPAEQPVAQPAAEAAAAPAPAASAADDQIAQLEKLAQLKEQGILTEEEFAAKKAQILGL